SGRPRQRQSGTGGRSSTGNSSSGSTGSNPRLVAVQPFSQRQYHQYHRRPQQQPAMRQQVLPFNNNNVLSPSGAASDAASADGGSGAANERPVRLELLLDLPPCPLEVASQHAWNPADRSLNVLVKADDCLTLHRQPVAQSTDCIRSLCSYSRGLHAWEICWPVKQRGTHAVVGVATAKCPLHCVGYHSLLGSNAESWGWDLGRGRLQHESGRLPTQQYPVVPHGAETEPLQVPDTFIMVLDMDEGSLSFVVDGQFLGVAFRGLKGKQLFPCVSAVWGHCEIRLRYLNGLEPEPLPLMLLCRSVIRKQLQAAAQAGKPGLAGADSLPLPLTVKDFLLYRDRRAARPDW
ncbi:hypothetical protein BOX15_Mlig001905g1, partial [Macrostomum lignano]